MRWDYRILIFAVDITDSYFQMLSNIFFSTLSAIYYIFVFFSGVCGMYISYSIYETKFTQKGRERAEQMMQELKAQDQMMANLKNGSLGDDDDDDDDEDDDDEDDESSSSEEEQENAKRKKSK